MDIEERNCPECGSSEIVCGNCGGRAVTPVDAIEGNPASKSISDHVLHAEDGGSFVIKQVCWDCGAAAERTVTVSVEYTEG